MLLSRYLGMTPHQVRFEYTVAGKPHLAPSQGERLLRFNLTHSGELLLIAVTDGRALGIDVEEVRNDIDVGEIAAHFFSPNEQRDLATLSGPRRIDAFFECWTRKEAYVKARGEGLSLPLDQFDVSLLPGESARLIETRPDSAEARRWQLEALSVADGYKAALAVEGKGWALQCVDWPAGRRL